MSLLWIIRHGQASLGTDNYDRLSDLGRAQVRFLGKYLADRSVVFDAVYSGSLERQHATARCLIENMHPDEDREPTVFPEFNEYQTESIIGLLSTFMIRENPDMAAHIGAMNTDRRAFQQVLETAMLRWVKGVDSMGHMETWPSFAARVRSGMAKVMREQGRGRNVAVCCSGGTISAVMHMALDLADETAVRLAWQIYNTSVSIFKYNDDRISLSSFNSIAHLELLNQPELLTYG